MKVMHNIGLLLVRMGKFRDAVTNFQHIMQEQGDFQTGSIQVSINILPTNIQSFCVQEHNLHSYYRVLQACTLYCVL